MKLSIGENIKRLRREKDMTQEDFAELLGVSCQSVSRWENGICYPDMELLPTISDLFQITVDKLLGISEAVEKVPCCRIFGALPNRGEPRKNIRRY